MKLYTYGLFKPGFEMSYLLKMYASSEEEQVVLSNFQLGTSPHLPYPFVRPVSASEGVVCSVWDLGLDYEKPMTLVTLNLCATKGLFDLVKFSDNECLFVAGPALLTRLESLGEERYTWWGTDDVWEWLGTYQPRKLVPHGGEENA